jgi:predicted secreted protein
MARLVVGEGIAMSVPRLDRLLVIVEVEQLGPEVTGPQQPRFMALVPDGM